MAAADSGEFTNEDYAKGLIGLAVFFGVVAYVCFAGWNGTRFPQAVGTNVPSVNIESADKLELAGAPGESIKFVIGVQMIGLDTWRTATGIHVTIGGKDYEVFAPREKDWGKELTVDLRQNEDQRLDAKVVVPQDAKVGQTLQGKLGGTMTVAKISSSGGFENVAVKPTNPVTIRVVSKEESAKLVADRENARTGAGSIELYIAIAAVALVPVCIFFARRLSKKR